MGTVGRVKNQHPGDASVHGGLGRYHVDLVSQCGLFCSTTGCSTSITQKYWLKTVSPERLCCSWLFSYWTGYSLGASISRRHLGSWLHLSDWLLGALPQV